MYGKFILAAVLGAFLYVQLGAALQCYSCNTPSTCNNPTTIICSQTNANATRDHLEMYFSDVVNTTTSDYNCLFQNYTQNNVVNMTYRGCVYRNQGVCTLNLNATHSSLVQANCTECSGDLCNGNPAGTFSSSLVTMFGSLLAVLIAKTIVH